MAGAKKKASLKQSAYRQKVKESGGFYLGVYIKGEAAQLLRNAKEQQQKSYGELVTQAMLANIFQQATDEQKNILKQEGFIKEGVKDFDWENIK